MTIFFDILSGIGKALGCFSLILGAALIFDYADFRSRRHEHKRYQSILLFISAVACYFPAHEMLDGLFSTMTWWEKGPFLISAALCAITFSFIISGKIHNGT